jgi:transketolase
MRTLPNMTVVAPGSPLEAAAATRALTARQGPAYLRLAKNGEPDCLPDAPFRIGAARHLRHGRDLTIATTGSLVASALEACDLLGEQEIEAGLVHLPTIKPLDSGAIAAALAAAPLLVTLEDHVLAGGFGSAVAETIADHGLAGRLVRLGIPDIFAPIVGSREHLLERYGLSPRGIAEAVRTRLHDRRLAA